MFNLFFNGQKICQISSFAETLERLNNETDNSIIYLSLFLEENEIPVDFDLNIFTKYAKPNSLSLIEITDNNGRKIYYNNFYERITRVKHFLDDDTSNDIPVRKVSIELEREAK